MNMSKNPETRAPVFPPNGRTFHNQNRHFRRIEKNKIYTLPRKMPTQARCERVPPAHDSKWGGLDLRVLQEDDLPLDPRSWGRSEVARWVSRKGGLPERFPMNGKALCLMTKDMFAARVPQNGQTLHQDFRRRLAKALALQDLVEKMAAH